MIACTKSFFGSGLSIQQNGGVVFGHGFGNLRGSWNGGRFPDGILKGIFGAVTLPNHLQMDRILAVLAFFKPMQQRECAQILAVDAQLHYSYARIKASHTNQCGFDGLLAVRRFIKRKEKAFATGRPSTSVR